jgi:DNA-binding transcriptional LysR family regulator
MDLRSIDLALLASLEMLLAERSVSGAAARLGLSQPAVSAQLKRLRALFDDPILVSAGRGMVLTARAQSIEAPLRRLLGDFTELVRTGAAFDPETSSRHFTIGMTEYAVAISAGRLIGAVRSSAPAITIEVRAIDSRRVQDSLEDGTVDLLIGGDFVINDTLKAVSLYHDPLVFVQRCGHPRGAGPLDAPAMLAADYGAVAIVRSRLGTVVDVALNDHDIGRRVVAKFPSFLPLVDALIRSDLVAILPARVAALFADRLDAFESPLPLPCYSAKAAWHSHNQSDDGHRWLRKLAADVLR